MNESDATPGQRWAVVGGGMLGLTTALRLAEAGHRVTLFEAAADFGGLADAWQVGDITWDRHYHVTLLSDSFLRNLLQELNLDEQMRWVETKTGFYTDGRLHSMSSSLDFLLFPPLSLWSKFRLGLTIFAGSRIRNWRRLEKVLVADWLRRWSGRKTFEKIWLPLLRSKLGENYRKTSAAFIWATIARLYAARRTGLKKELFGYLPGGYARVLDRLVQRLRELGVQLRAGHPVEHVRTDDEGSVNIHRCGNVEEFDRAVLTTPSSLVPKLLPQLCETQAKQHAAIEYLGIVCASLLLRNPLDKFYVTNITDGNAPFTGVIEMSTLVDPRELGGHSLVYLPYYLAQDAPEFEMSDDELRETSLNGLEGMYPAFRREDVLGFRVSRVKRVMAISTIGYSEKLPPMNTSVPNVFVVNSAQIVNGTLNVNETVKLAESAVRKLLLAEDHQSKVQLQENQHVETLC